MEITLKNFKCFTEKTISLPESGLTLIKAPSGAGKSTIVSSIIFALTGRGKKLNKHGTKGATAILKYQGYTITRCTSPKTLNIVTPNNEKFEHQEAQSHINNHLLHATEDEFVKSSYSQQNTLNSIISMTPSERLEFIETFVFNDDTHTTVKKMLTEYQRKLNNSIISLQSSINAITGMIQMFDTNIEETTISSLVEAKQQIEQYESTIEETKNALRELNSDLKIAQTRYDTFLKTKATHQSTINKINRYEAEFENYTRELTALPSQVTVTTQLEKIKTSLAQFNESAEFMSLSLSLTAAKNELQQHVAETNQKLDEYYASPDFMDDEEYAKFKHSLKTETEKYEEYTKQLSEKNEARQFNFK